MAKYYAYRYFLIEQEQVSLFDNLKRQEVMKKVIKELQDRHLWIEDKKNVLYYIKELYSDTYLLKLGKQKNTTKYFPDKKDICEIEEKDNYPYVNIIFNIDSKEQIFLIEKNTGIFREIEQSIRKLQRIIESITKNEGYTLKIQPITFNNNFWKCINESEGISEVEMKLNSPNLFGASFETNRFLEMLKSMYNNDTFSFKLSNQDKNLTVNRDDIGDTVDYISEGGGSWSIKRMFKGKQETVKSINEKNIKSVDIDINGESSESINNKVIYLDNYYRKNSKNT